MSSKPEHIEQSEALTPEERRLLAVALEIPEPKPPGTIRDRVRTAIEGTGRGKPVPRLHSWKAMRRKTILGIVLMALACAGMAVLPRVADGVNHWERKSDVIRVETDIPGVTTEVVETVEPHAVTIRLKGLPPEHQP